MGAWQEVVDVGQGGGLWYKEEATDVSGHALPLVQVLSVRHTLGPGWEPAVNRMLWFGSAFNAGGLGRKTITDMGSGCEWGCV